MKIVKSREFSNGAVYAIKTDDNYLIESTDTFLPYYTKNCINEHTNELKNYNLGSRADRWMIGVSCMSGCPVRCGFCLVAGTKILMSDFTTKNIEDINIGDSIIASKHSAKQTQNSKDYATKYSTIATVLNKFSRDVKDDIYRITLDNGYVIECTGNHTISNKRNHRIEYTPANKLNVGDTILCSKKIVRCSKDTKEKMLEIASISDITVEKMNTIVYNIETTEKNYIANGIVVHNCATGKMKRYRNLTSDEILEQVKMMLELNKGVNPSDCKEFKINYTRMGEPFLNIKNVKEAIIKVDNYIKDNYNVREDFKVHHYISTIGIKGSDFSFIKDNITLQISLHSLDEDRRKDLIPVKCLMSLEELGSIRTDSNLKTTLNMTLVDFADFDIKKLEKYFDKEYFFIKLSPINENDVSKSNNMGSGIIKSVSII